MSNFNSKYAKVYLLNEEIASLGMDKSLQTSMHNPGKTKINNT